MAYLAFFKSQPTRKFFMSPWEDDWMPFERSLDWQSDIFDDLFEPMSFVFAAPDSRKRRLCLTSPKSQKRKKITQDKPWHTMVYMAGFSPEEVTAKLTDRKLALHGQKKVGNEEMGYDTTESLRYVTIPEDVDVDSVKLAWNEDGSVHVVGKKLLKKCEVAEKTLPEAVAKEAKASKKHENSDPTRKSDDQETRVVKADENCLKDLAVDKDCLSLIPFINAPTAGKIVEEDGKKVYKMTLNLKDYDASEVKVKAIGNSVRLSGEHKEESDNGKWYSHFSRMWTVPEGVSLDDMCTQFSDGKMCITAPVKCDSSHMCTAA